MKKIFLCLLLTIVAVFAFTGCVWELDDSHEHEFASTEYPLTCESDGYILYRCIYCDFKYQDSVVKATGHLPKNDGIWVEPTCTHEGGRQYICSKCGKEYIEPSTLQPMLPHTEVADEAREATCLREGVTYGVHCSVCGEVLITQEVIEKLPHKPVVMKEGYPATCTEDGLADELFCSLCETTIQEQKVIKTPGHADEDDDDLCDVCNVLLVNDFTEIRTEEDLLNISRNLQGKYILREDITLTNEWAPLGSQINPFKGKLYGDGHTISGLTVSGGSDNGTVELGLFHTNYGTIRDIKLENVTLSSNYSTAVMGGIAAYNYGTVYEILVENLTVSYTFGIEVNTGGALPNLGQDHKYIINHSATVGGVVGENHGTVESCGISGFGASFHDKSKFVVDVLIGSGYVLTSTSTVNLGGIVGVNDGTVKGCVCDTAGTVILKAETSRNKGESSSVINANIGSIIGSGNVPQNSSGVKPTVSQDQGKDCTIKYTITSVS